MKAAIGLEARARRARRPALGDHRTVGRRQVVAAQCAVPGRESPRRRDQRIGEQGSPHDRRRADAPAARRRGRLRHRHARPARGRPLGASGRAISTSAFPRCARCATNVDSPTVVTSPSRIAPCATAVRTDGVSAERYESYMRLLEELEARPLDASPARRHVRTTTTRARQPSR